MLHQMMLNAADGRRRGSLVGYAAQRESYMSEQQQVVEYISSQSPRINSPKKNITNYNYKEPENTLSRGNPFLVPWSSPRAGTVGDFSPRKSSSPSYRKPSEHFHGKQDNYGNYNREDNEYYEEEEEEEGDDGDYEEYDEDHVRGKNRVSFRDDHMRTDKGKSHYDHQGSYHANGGNYYKGNEYSSPRSNYGASPFANNKPKKENYYEPLSHGSPIGNNSGLAPIKTRPNNPNRAMDYYPNESQQQQPKYSSPKSKDHQRGNHETIDSNEARRRYGKNPSRAEHVVGESYAHTIDSREAARRYNGVFVP